MSVLALAKSKKKLFFFLNKFQRGQKNYGCKQHYSMADHFGWFFFFI